MASLTRMRRPSAKPSWPCSVNSCRTLFKSSGSVWWAIWFGLLDVLVTPQQETSVARPRPVFHARGASTPPGFGCARLATLAFAPPHPGGVEAEGRKTIYRKTFTPPRHTVCGIPLIPHVLGRKVHGSLEADLERD